MVTRPGQRLCTQNHAKPAQGTQIAHAGRRLTEPESVCGLGIRQVLKMPQEHDFAVVLAERFECGVKSFEELMADGLGSGCQPLVPQLRRQIK